MYSMNAMLMYKAKFNEEATGCVHLFSAPEENPEVHVFEVSSGDRVVNMVVAENKDSVITRIIEDPAELDVLRQIKGSQGEEVGNTH